MEIVEKEGLKYIIFLTNNRICKNLFHLQKGGIHEIQTIIVNN